MIEFGSRIDRFCRCKLCLFEALINPSRAGERVSTSRKLLVPRPAVRRLAKIYNRMEERVRRLLGKGATISRNEGKGAVIIGGGCYDYRRGVRRISVARQEDLLAYYVKFTPDRGSPNREATARLALCRCEEWEP